MKIFMLETCQGSEDGHSVKKFKRYHTYDMAQTLAASFISKNKAVSVEKPKDTEAFIHRWNISTATGLGIL